MIARTVMAAVLGRIESGRLHVVEGGRTRSFGPPGSPLTATITVHSPRFWPSFFRGSAGLARSYRDGEWSCDDLVSLVRIGAREMPRLDRLRRPVNPLHRAFTRVARNTRDRARTHVAAHYDLGDDLFETFLDATMTYSCGLFGSPEMTLAEAQERKLDAICRKLELRPDDHLLEIGTGWGSLAIHAAGRYGCRVTTTTISREQHATATARVRAAGLSDRVEILLEDYRDLRGRYDKLVSVEMIEAVGWQYFDEYFRRCGELLAPGGLMVLQAILIDDDAYEAEKATRSFINEYIFPSGCLPSMRVVEDCTERVTDLRVTAVEDLTAHYPETLRRWRENFLAASGRVAELGYDEGFRRLWELYFAYCEGGFRERRITVAQIELAKPAYRRSLENMRFEIASMSTPGPREASLASASLPPGPST
jgi:cyclopropane-fatty-acyl-phospholipid synthase